MTDNIGTQAWWLSADLWGRHGIIESVLRLLEQERISRAKALELIQDAVRYRSQAVPLTVTPVAPWDELNWCDDGPSAWWSDVPPVADLEFAVKGLELALAAFRQLPHKGRQARACQAVAEFLRRLARTSPVEQVSQA